MNLSISNSFFFHQFLRFSSATNLRHVMLYGRRRCLKRTKTWCNNVEIFLDWFVLIWIVFWANYKIYHKNHNLSRKKLWRSEESKCDRAWNEWEEKSVWSKLSCKHLLNFQIEVWLEFVLMCTRISIIWYAIRSNHSICQQILKRMECIQLIVSGCWKKNERYA